MDLLLGLFSMLPFCIVFSEIDEMFLPNSLNFGKLGWNNPPYRIEIPFISWANNTLPKVKRTFRRVSKSTIFLFVSPQLRWSLISKIFLLCQMVSLPPFAVQSGSSRRLYDVIAFVFGDYPKHFVHIHLQKNWTRYPSVLELARGSWFRVKLKHVGYLVSHPSPFSFVKL